MHYSIELGNSSYSIHSVQPNIWVFQLQHVGIMNFWPGNHRRKWKILRSLLRLTHKSWEVDNAWTVRMHSFWWACGTHHYIMGIDVREDARRTEQGLRKSPCNLSHIYQGRMLWDKTLSAALSFFQLKWNLSLGWLSTCSDRWVSVHCGWLCVRNRWSLVIGCLNISQNGSRSMRFPFN